MSITRLNQIDNLFGDNIAFAEAWDFSHANVSEETRILAITQVASICYQSPKALGSEALYNRLKAESIGLPSSSFEFVPILLDYANPQHAEVLKKEYSYVKKFGEVIENGKYLLTNLRSLIYDYENEPKYYSFDIRYIYNTLNEVAIIKKNFHVFLFKVDLPTRSQLVRHRVSWQELSRRYVSGKRIPFDFYISNGMLSIKTDNFDTKSIIELCIQHYMNAIEDGVKPQEARRIIPQAAYTQIWGGFMPKQLDNFFKLRLDKHAQWEIKKTAKAMKELIEKND